MKKTSTKEIQDLEQLGRERGLLVIVQKTEI